MTRRMISEGVLEVDQEDVVKVASAISSPTRFEILKYIQLKEADLGEISALIKQSKANASAQVRILEKADLVKVIYKPGQRGVKKTCALNVREVKLKLQ